MARFKGMFTLVIAGAATTAVARVCDELRRVRRLASAQASLAGELDLDRIALGLADAARTLVRADAVEVIAERADGQLSTRAQSGESDSTPTTLRNGSDLVRLRRRRHLRGREIADLETLLAAASQASRSARLYELTETLRSEAVTRERDHVALSARLFVTEELERRRLALALHDGPQQTMAGVALMLDAASKAQRAGEFDEAERIMLGALEQAREIVRSLRGLGFALEPLTLRDHGFCAAFGELADRTGERHRISVEVDCAAIDALGVGVQVHLYRIAQEALANAVKHADATTVRVDAQRRGDGSVVLRISDDGRGALPEQFDRRGHHRGMESMRERASGAGGELTVDSSPGQGTRIEVVVSAPRLTQHAA